MKTPQPSDCCKAYIRLTGEKRPNAFACVKCGRIIGTELPQPTTNNLEWKKEFGSKFNIAYVKNKGRSLIIT